jgi:2-phosphosulfolactate phosphatase
MPSGARFLARWEVAGVDGAVVVVDVIRAFTTAAYAFAGGASHIYLVDSVAEALAMKAADPDVLAMGEDRGRRPSEFDFSNSPVEIAAADVDGRVLVQRTSAGTRGVVAARSATRLWCASLVCASATAAAVSASGLGDPTYVITGRFEDQPQRQAIDDLATANLIDRARVGDDLDAVATAAFVANTEEAKRTLTLGRGHVDPDDIAYATRVDAFDFAMEVRRVGDLLRLDRIARDLKRP